MTIMDEVNRIADTSTEGIEEADYARKIYTSGTEVIDKLTGADPGSPAKRLKTFVPLDMETISDPVISRFIAKLQVHLNSSTEVICGAQASISLLNRNIGDVPEDHTKFLCAMGDIMKKLVSDGEVLYNNELDLLMKEAMEAHLLNVNIKTSVYDAMEQATSTAAKVGSVTVNDTQHLTPVSEDRLNSMRHALNMGDQNIGVLQQTLTGLCNVVGTLEQKMHYLSQHDTAQSIKYNLTISLRDGFDVQLSTSSAELDGVRQLTELGGFNTVVGYFKSLTNVTVWL